MGERADRLPAEATASGYLPWMMLAAAAFAQTGLQVGIQSLPPVAPLIQADFAITRAQIGLFGTVLSIGGTVALLPAGWLVDRFGCRALLAAGPVVTGVFLISAARTNEYWQMLVALLCVGLGAGVAAPPGARAVVNWFGPPNRGTAMGFKQTGTSLGGVIAAAIIPALAILVGWRAGVGMVSLGIIGVGILCYGIYRDPAVDRRSSAIVQGRGLHEVLANRDLRVCCIVSFCFTGILVTVPAYLVLYLTEVTGLPLTTAGLLLGLMQASAVTARLLSGLISDRLLGGRRKGVLIISGAGSLFSIAVAALFGPLLPVWGQATIFIIFGLGGLGWSGVFLALIAEIAGKEAAGVAAGAGLAAGGIGGALLPPLFGLVVDLSHSYALAWGTLALAPAIGIAALSQVRERAKLSR